MRTLRLSIGLVLAAAACRPPGWGQGDDTPVDAAGDAAAAPDGHAPDATALDAAPVTCDATFRLENHAGAVSVWLTGDFVAWAGQPAAGAIPLTLGADSAWTVVHTFDAGSYQYKFIIDGSSWIPDPANPNTVDDTYGGLNSVYVCF